MSVIFDQSARFFLLALLASACGGAPPEPDLHAAFRRIQEHEAQIAHRSADADACEGRCAAAEEVCSAADAICTIAGEIDDADARARCELARERCPREGR
jgi:hypothetical protein